MPYISLAELQQRVWARVDNNQLLFPANVVTNIINESIRVLNGPLCLFQSTIYLTTQANRVWYSIQGMGLTFPNRVQYGTQYLEKTSVLQIGRGRPQWVQETSANQLSPPASWLPFGFNTIAIWPADSNGGEQLAITGCAEPPQLVNPTDTIQLNNAVFAAFDEYAYCLLLLKESPKAFAQASVGYQAFLKIIKNQTQYRSWISPTYFIAEAQQPLKRG